MSFYGKPGSALACNHRGFVTVPFRRPLVLALLILCFAINTPVHGDGESIQVHGDWAVTVTNTDGSIAQQVDFPNALVGPELLVGLLVGRQFQEQSGMHFLTEVEPGVPGWSIAVVASGVAETENCQGFLRVPPANLASTLTRANVSNADAAAFTLSRNLTLPIECVTGGSYSIDQVASIAQTQTVLGQALYPALLPFTSKTLDVPITGILPDQVVTLKVTISFE